MSEEKHETRVKRLMAEAHRCKSLTGLRGIARDLERLSAWSEAAEVDRMADAISERNAQAVLEGMLR